MVELLKLLPYHDYNKSRQFGRFTKPFNPPDIQLGLAAQYSIIDASMFLPIDANNQLNIFIYKYSKDEKFIDIRIFRKINNKFIPTKQGVRLPIELFSQLMLRLKHLEKKYGNDRG